MTTSLYLSSHVLLLFRRLVNVVSTLSISNHYWTTTQPQSQPQPEKHRQPPPPDIIHQLLANPALRDPLRTPRFPIVLCHGLYGFDSRGPTSFPSMRMHYWSNVLRILRGTVGAEVIVTSVPGTGSITSRAIKLDEQLKVQARGRGVNFLAHSMGGLDCRHLISHIQPRAYAPLSLTSISTPHRGSPFMDWCATNIGIGKLRQQEKELKEELRRSSRRDLGCIPSASASASTNPTTTNTNATTNADSFSLPSLILSIVDSPAYANLTSRYLNDVFNPATPDSPAVKYWSVAGRISARSVSVWHPFWLPKMVLDGAEEVERSSSSDDNINKKRDWEWGNDGLVTVRSAMWGEFLGVLEGCDHWEMRGARGIEFGVDLPALPVLGLGPSAPPPSSQRHSGGVSPEATPLQVQGDGWGFGEWTRFVGAWKRSGDDKSDGGSSVDSRGDKASASSSSADKISMVFDWLVERVPAPTTTIRGGSSTTTTTTTSTTTTTTSSGGGGAEKFPPPPFSSSSSLSSSETKRRMEREDRGREDKRELARREDLERFYVALARRTYDAGL